MAPGELEDEIQTSARILIRNGILDQMLRLSALLRPKREGRHVASTSVRVFQENAGAGVCSVGLVTFY